VHDHGIPDRPDWPDGVLDAVAQFRQGDLVRGLPLFYWADTSTPIHDRTRAYAAPGGGEPEVVTFADPAPYGLITTQTCDLALEGNGKPTTAWVQLAPVFNGMARHPNDPTKRLLPGNVRKLVQAGRGYQNLLFIPDLPDEGFWFADLSFEVPVERGWLAAQGRINGFAGDEAEREAVGRRLAWLRSRPALDGRFVTAVQKPIGDALKALRKDDPDGYEEMATDVIEIGFVLTTRLAASAARLCVFHVGASEEKLDWWRELWTTTLFPGAEAEGFNLMPLEVEDICGNLPVSEYLKFTRLPLATISPYPEWFGASPGDFGT
jgi:hypothetical protein